MQRYSSGQMANRRMSGLTTMKDGAAAAAGMRKRETRNGVKRERNSSETHGNNTPPSPERAGSTEGVAVGLTSARCAHLTTP